MFQRLRYDIHMTEKRFISRINCFVVMQLLTFHLLCSLHDHCCSVSLRLPCHSLPVCKHSLFATLQWSNDTMHKNCPRFNFAEQKKSLILRGWPTFEQSDIMHVLTGMLWPRNNSDNGVTLKRGQIKKIPNCNVCNYQLDNKASVMIKVRPKETKITSGTTA